MECFRRPVVVLLFFGVLLSPGTASADLDDLSDQWLPRTDGAAWTYEWSDSEYSPTPRTENVVIQRRSGTAFRLRWDEVSQGDYDTPAQGTIDFRHENAGLVNLTYQSSQPPPQFPVLCASASECGNSLAGTMYMLIWGTRSPVIAEPLVRGTRWSATGGASNDVGSDNRYLGQETISVPAFPGGVVASKIQSEITQAGAIGDPYGSGVRTVWWVRGVGPVKITFRHSGGELGQSQLMSTNLAPLPPPPEQALSPLNRGDTMDFRWRNSRHMKRWSRQRFTVEEVVNNTARVDVKHLSGPINVAGSYTFSTRLDGLTNLGAFTKAATRSKFPTLGPRGAPSDKRRRFYTALDFMVYGFSPVVPAYPQEGQVWRSSRDSRDWSIFGVTGSTEVVRGQRVRTPAGRFDAVVVRSRLRQAGFPYGSGTRTMYFASGKGLVRLVFKHGDGSVSTVERLK